MNQTTSHQINENEPNTAEKPALKRSPYIRYSAIMFLFYFAISVTAYVSVYLEANGMNGTGIGTIMSISALIGAVTLPLWGLMSDKLRSPRTALVICLMINAILFVLVPVTLRVYIGPVLLSSVLITLSMGFRGPCNNLVIGWMVKESTMSGINYSSVRLWGSVGYSLMLILLSVIVPLWGINVIFFLCVALTGLLILMCYSVKEDKLSVQQRPTVKELRISRLFRNYYFMGYLGLIVAMVIYDAITMVYIPFLIKDVSADTALTGLVVGIRALFEMGIMLTIVFFKKRIALPYLLVAAGILFGIEHMLYPYAGNMRSILLISMISGVASGVYLGLGPSYVLSIVPPELNTTAQALCGSIMMATFIAGSFVGGVLMDRFGVRNLLFGCGLVIFGITALFVFSLYLGRRVLKVDTPPSVMKPIG